MDLRNNQRVAVKKIREAFNNLEDAKRTLREARLLRHLKHKNVISFRELLPPSPDLSFSSLYVVMELMDTDLYQVMGKHVPCHLSMPFCTKDCMGKRKREIERGREGVGDRAWERGRGREGGGERARGREGKGEGKDKERKNE